MRNSSIQEECGVFGIYAKSDIDVPKMTYYALYALQHRGQESCGIAINDDNRITNRKGMGLVSEVFDENTLASMKGNIAIGHVRYSSQGDSAKESTQPLAINHFKGTLTVAFNGKIANSAKLRYDLERVGSIFHTTNDSEVIALLVARARLETKSIEEAILKVIPMLQGSFSIVFMSPRKLIAVRDPLGIRPLCIGKIEQDAIIFASESCALTAIGAQFERDIKPGEMVVVTVDGVKCDETYCSGKSGLCIFEHIYFARPDSIIDGQSVYNARLAAGALLSQRHPVDADLVIGVPDSGVTAAIGYARASGIPYGEGFIKNRYIGRTFIQPKQSMREVSVSIKLGVIKANVDGKRVIMVDDSIVRGTTSKNIIKALKSAGAKEVHVRISSPEFLYPCYFGTDIPSRNELASCKFSVSALAENIGADSLGFLTVDEVCDIAKDSKLNFCTGCFSGKYPVEIDK
ncbi:MAG: amidophosphoribosyltransferase [Clostridia bacterium]